MLFCIFLGALYALITPPPALAVAVRLRCNVHSFCLYPFGKPFLRARPYFLRDQFQLLQIATTRLSSRILCLGFSWHTLMLFLSFFFLPHFYASLRFFCLLFSTSCTSVYEHFSINFEIFPLRSSSLVSDLNMRRCSLHSPSLPGVRFLECWFCRRRTLNIRLILLPLGWLLHWRTLIAPSRAILHTFYPHIFICFCFFLFYIFVFLSFAQTVMAA